MLRMATTLSNGAAGLALRVAALPLLLTLAVGCSGTPSQRGSTTPQDQARSPLVAADTSTAAYPSLLLGTFDAAAAARPREGGQGSAGVRSIEELRRPLPVVQAMPPLGDDVARLLSRAAEALARNDLEAAEVAASDAAEIAPDRPEPVELQFLVALGSGRPAEVRKAILRLGELDPRNPIPVAFAGLEGIQNGDDKSALESLSWFVGRDALPRRGVAVPLPTATAELEEQCALSALRLGYPQAALAAVDAAAASVPRDRAVEARLSLLRGDAQHAAGQRAAALESFERTMSLAGSGSGESTDARSVATLRAMAVLAALRRDAVLCEDRNAAIALEGAVDALLRDPTDSIALLRVERLAPAAGADARERLERRIAAAAAAGDVGALRIAVARALLSRGAGLGTVEKAVVANARDRGALRPAMRLLADRGADRAVACAVAAAAAQPNELDAITRALLGCGADVEALLDAIRDDNHGAAGDAVRSRIYGQYGFAEEAFAIADGARSRDRASSVALAACALAAAELEDETLLAEVDDDALAAGSAIARTLAACGLKIGDPVRAGDRAARALTADPTDTRARLFAAVALLEQGAERERAVEELQGLAGGSDSVAADAFALLADLQRGATGGSQGASDEPSADSADAGAGSGEAEGRLPVPSERAQVLVAAANQLDRIRHPLAIECIAVAEEIEPGIEAGRRIAGRATRPDAPRKLEVWARLMLDEAPALPARRRVAASLREPRSASEVPASPLQARFDALELASDAVRARELVERSAQRPRTAAALAAQAEALLMAGDASMAVRCLEGLAGSTSGAVPPGAARRLLAVASEIASRHGEHAAAMQQVANQIVARLASVGPEEIAAAMGLAITARVEASDIDMLAQVLARSCRANIVDARGRFSQVFERLLRTEDDPYPVARLADALARETRLESTLRAFFCNAAVALQASAGGPASQSAELIRLLSSQGVAPFARSDDSETTLAESLLRAASAYSLVGDAQGSDELLLAAIAADGQLAPALNNLAFSRIEAGRIDEETAGMAERAAQIAPDDPSVLDTLGVLRYHHGRFRDDASGPGAITLFRQALRVDPDDPSLATLDHLGDALWRDGDQPGAIRCWQQVAQVAKLRYPPNAIARGLREFQRREFGVELVSPAEFVQKEYGRIVDRAEQKLQEVARGAAPSVAECRGIP